MADRAKPELFRNADERVGRLARKLIREARLAALSVLRPSDGFPAVSRVNCATDFTGRLVVLVSALSLHASALDRDGRCSVLVGEPEKGDPLAHPRLTLFAHTQPLARESAEFATVRARFLARHPKAGLYIDFPDFQFLVLRFNDAFVNGGFGEAYELAEQDIEDLPAPDLQEAAKRAADHMNADHADAIDEMAAKIGENVSGWRIATTDRRGFEIIRGSTIRRIEFDRDPAGEGGYRRAFVDLLGKGGD